MLDYKGEKDVMSQLNEGLPCVMYKPNSINAGACGCGQKRCSVRYRIMRCLTTGVSEFACTCGMEHVASSYIDIKLVLPEYFCLVRI